VKTQRRPSVHRGISFGTIAMTALTVVVLGLSASILPRLLGTADFHVNISGAMDTLMLDDALTALTLSDIPIVDQTPAPEPSATPKPAESLTAATPVPVAHRTLRKRVRLASLKS